MQLTEPKDEKSLCALAQERKRKQRANASEEAFHKHKPTWKAWDIYACARRQGRHCLIAWAWIWSGRQWALSLSDAVSATNKERLKDSGKVRGHVSCKPVTRTR